MWIYGVLRVEASFIQSVNDSSHSSGIQVKASVRKTLQKAPSETRINQGSTFSILLSGKHLFFGQCHTCENIRMRTTTVALSLVEDIPRLANVLLLASLGNLVLIN